MRYLFLLSCLFLAACSSAPTTDRATLPDRPEVHRPEGAEPEGLAEMRETIAAQRAEARERDNALNFRATPMSQTPNTPWYEDAFEFLGGAVRWAAGVATGGGL
jgi:hypothetical protein